MADDRFDPIRRAFEQAAARFSTDMEAATERLRAAMGEAEQRFAREAGEARQAFEKAETAIRKAIGEVRGLPQHPSAIRKPPRHRPPLPMPVRPNRPKNLSGGAAAPIHDRDSIDARDQ
jgi:hypothetical protein